MSLKTLYADNEYRMQVRDQRSMDGFSSEGVISTGVLTWVYDAGTKTLSTLYADPNRIATLANPITRSQFATDGEIRFWSASTSHDLVINDASGNTGVYSGVTPNSHQLPLNTTGSSKCLVFPIAFNSGGTEVDTGLDLPKNAMVIDAAVEVVTLDATETVNIGLLSTETAGDADGFLAAVSVANAGFVANIAYTTGSNEVYLSTNSYGVLLASGSLGNDVATDVGSLAMKGHVVTGSNATSISYTPSTSDTLAGYGYVFFRMLR